MAETDGRKRRVARPGGKGRGQAPARGSGPIEGMSTLFATFLADLLVETRKRPTVSSAAEIRPGASLTAEVRAEIADLRAAAETALEDHEAERRDRRVELVGVLQERASAPAIDPFDLGALPEGRRPAGAVVGRVRDRATMAGLAGLVVVARSATTDEVLGWTRATADGSFSLDVGEADATTAIRLDVLDDEDGDPISTSVTSVQDMVDVAIDARLLEQPKLAFHPPDPAEVAERMAGAIEGRGLRLEGRGRAK